MWRIKLKYRAMQRLQNIRVNYQELISSLPLVETIFAALALLLLLSIRSRIYYTVTD